MILYCILISVTLASAIQKEVLVEDVVSRDSESSLPAYLELNVKRQGHVDIKLQLHENKRLKANAPVYETILKNGIRKAVAKKSQPIEGIKFYHDKSRHAAVVISCVMRPNGTCQRLVEGVLSIDGESYDIAPAPEQLSTRGIGDTRPIPYLIEKDETKRNFKDDVIINNELISSNALNKGELASQIKRLKTEQNKKRQATTKKAYTVETIVVIDPPRWEYWQRKTIENTGTMNDTDTEYRIRKFYALVIHGVSLNFESIDDPDFSINVVISRFLILKTKADTSDKVASFLVPGSDGVIYVGDNYGTYMKALANFIRPLNLPNGDHWMIFTGVSISVAGVSFLGGVCEWNRVSLLITATLTYTSSIASHELGHNFNADHDGSGTSSSCSSGDNYILGGSGPILKNYWRFSPCSIASFKSYVASRGECLLDHGDLYNEKEWKTFNEKLPGEHYNADAQCKLKYGGSSSLCNSIADIDFCTDMDCKISTSSCHSDYPAHGTPCGLPSLNKWCIEGLCVSRTVNGTTAAPPTTTGDTEKCYYTTADTYQGIQSTSKSGLTCQRWDSQSPHSHKNNVPQKFLDKSVAEAANYCRDPTVEGVPWCYVDKRWDFCDIPKCASDSDVQTNCSNRNLQYQQTQNKTKSGIPCQRWDAQSPHTHTNTDPEKFPDTTLAEAANFCRNPDGEVSSWCYTTDPAKRWELCDTLKCTDDKCFSGSVEYQGSRSVTKDGFTCQRWDLKSPHYNYFTNSPEKFPDQTVADATNYCRNPDGESAPWCYLGATWEYCGISKCE